MSDEYKSVGGGRFEVRGNREKKQKAFEEQHLIMNRKKQKIRFLPVFQA